MTNRHMGGYASNYVQKPFWWKLSYSSEKKNLCLEFGVSYKVRFIMYAFLLSKLIHNFTFC